MQFISRVFLALSFFLISTASLGSGGDSELPRLIALENATVIDGQGNDPLAAHTVLIEGDRIKAVFPSGKRRLPAQAVRVDLQGKYLLPGLIDSHVHLATDPEAGDSIKQSVPLLGHYLRGGVTAVRDMGGDGRVLAYLARQTLIDQVDGPDIFYSTIIGGPEFFSDPRTISSAKGFAPGTTPWMRAVTTDSDLATLLSEARGAGVTGIKIYRHVPTEQMKPLALAAQQQGLMSWAHLDVFPAPAQSVAEAGVTAVSHSAYFLGRDREEQGRWKKSVIYKQGRADTESARKLIATLADKEVILDATLVIFDRNARKTGEPYFINADLAGVDFTRQAHLAGVKIAAGTDQAITPEKPLPPVHDELILLVERAGLSPLEAIQAATSHGAQLLGKANEIGAVTEGLKANLLVLNSDPTSDIGNTSDIAHVIKNGRFIYRGLEGLKLPFSDARTLDGQLWLSGQIGNLPGTLALVKGGIAAETEQALSNIDGVLQSYGLSREDIRKCTVMLADISEWGEANEVYKAYFNTEPMPARSAFGANGLALGARIELECIAEI